MEKGLTAMAEINGHVGTLREMMDKAWLGSGSVEPPWILNLDPE